jgi:hypothetical protein
MLLKTGFLLAGVVASLSCSDCRERISARLYDESGTCLQEWQPVGCNPNQGSCPAASTYAVDGAGRCFFFRDLCLPAGFTRVIDSDRCPSPAAQVADCP